jgi:hypothetical protein
LATSDHETRIVEESSATAEIEAGIGGGVVGGLSALFKRVIACSFGDKPARG